MALVRTTISIDEDVKKLADAICAPNRENRDFSNLCEQALKEYCQMRGVTSDSAELLSAAKELGAEIALAALRRELRKRGKAAA